LALSSYVALRQLRRERLPLVVVSLVLVLYELAGVRFSSISVFGTNVELTYPESVGWVLRIGWFYCFLRYVQWLRELDSKEYKTRLDQEFFRFLLNPAKRAFMRSDAWEEHRGCRTKVAVRPTDPPHRDIMFGGWEVPIWLDYSCSEPKRESGSLSVQPLVKGVPLLLAKIEAFLTVLLVTPYFTEYWLPVLVGIVPACLWLTRLVTSLYTLYVGT